MSELVSIVVTSYNHAEFLQQRMESLFAQTYADIEIIVVDDGSTDGSTDFLNKYKTHPRVRLFFLESNKGYVFASNFGVDKAKGEYIVFAECDDFSEPDQITFLYQAITTDKGVGVAWSASNLTDEAGKLLSSDFIERNITFQKHCHTDVRIPGLLLLKFMLYANVIPNMSAAMFRKSLFTRIGGLSEKYILSADLDLWIRMAEAGDFHYLRKPLNNYRTHPSTVRNKLGTSVQLVEMLDIISYIKGRISLTLTENFELNMHMGKRWFQYAKYEFSSFKKTFRTAFLNAIQKKPQLLLFILLNIPVLGFKKIWNTTFPATITQKISRES